MQDLYHQPYDTNALGRLQRGHVQLKLTVLRIPVSPSGECDKGGREALTI